MGGWRVRCDRGCAAIAVAFGGVRSRSGRGERRPVRRRVRVEPLGFPVGVRPVGRVRLRVMPARVRVSHQSREREHSLLSVTTRWTVVVPLAVKKGWARCQNADVVCFCSSGRISLSATDQHPVDCGGARAEVVGDAGRSPSAGQPDLDDPLRPPRHNVPTAVCLPGSGVRWRGSRRPPLVRCRCRNPHQPGGPPSFQDHRSTGPHVRDLPGRYD
ncbi:hypothetical protein H4W33_008504 [Kibdelosporangium phytohabitans]|nr:hypothetical protein [Kibdelosporangium phytohabitans]